MSNEAQPRFSIRRLAHVRLALRLVWDAARWWTPGWVAILVLRGLLPAVVVSLTKWLVDGVAALVESGAGWEEIEIVLIPGLLMGGALLLQRVLGSVAEWVNAAQAELVQDHVKGLIHEKAVAADYGFFESSEFYDRLEQANGQAGGRTLSLLQSLAAVLQSGVTFVSFAAILAAYSVFLPFVLVLSAAPALYIVVRHNRRYHRWWTRTTPDRRWAQYFDLMLTIQAAAAEVRINNLGDYFHSNYQQLRTRLRKERVALVRRQAVAKLFAGVLALLITGAAMAWMVWGALRGARTLGDLALFYGAFSQGQTLMSSLLSNSGQVYANTLFLEHLFDFLDQEPQVVDPPSPVALPAPVRGEVAFERVTFAYPETERLALRDFSLHIPAGQIVAVVGANGAGKSTLIKLLCRFYDPDAGSVRLDGIDVRDLAPAELRRQIAVMFQFPMKYQLAAAKNIELGDLDRPHHGSAVEQAARGAGAHDFIERLPRGYDTLLGRWFAEGTELSGGEWQRVALARAFLRDAPVVVLDEPTSFMDSWAEAEWLRRFRRMVQGRTALLITHRFTTAMQADTIHVMEGGEVVESGTHAELVALGGRYAASWVSQMRAADEVLHDV